MNRGVMPIHLIVFVVVIYDIKIDLFLLFFISSFLKYSNILDRRAEISGILSDGGWG